MSNNDNDDDVPAPAVPQTDDVTPTVNIGGDDVPIVQVNWSDWQTCEDVPTGHWHTYDDAGNSVCGNNGK